MIHAEHLLSKTPPEGDNAIDPALPAAESSKKKKPAAPASAEAKGEPANRPERRAGLWTAAGIGIGSAAIAAALIYANRAKGGKDDA